MSENSDITRLDLKTLEESLGGILGWVQRKKARAVTKDVKKSSPSKPWGWVTGIVVAIVVLFGLASIAWYLWKKGREIAKLKHREDVLKEKKHQIKIDESLATEAAKQEKIIDDIIKAEEDIKKVKQRIHHLEQQRREAHKKIDVITSWEDLDAYLGRD